MREIARQLYNALEMVYLVLTADERLAHVVEVPSKEEAISAARQALDAYGDHMGWNRDYDPREDQYEYH